MKTLYRVHNESNGEFLGNVDGINEMEALTKAESLWPKVDKFDLKSGLSDDQKLGQFAMWLVEVGRSGVGQGFVVTEENAALFEAAGLRLMQSLVGDMLMESSLKNKIPLSDFCKKHGYSLDTARAAARRGDIRGVEKKGRDWMIPATSKWAPKPEGRAVTTGEGLKRKRKKKAE